MNLYRFTKPFAYLSVSLTMLSSITPTAINSVHADTTTVANKYSSQTSDLKTSINKLLIREAALKEKIAAARKTLVSTNNQISNAEIKSDEYINQAADKKSQLQDKRVELDKLDNQIKSEKEQLMLLYQKMQSKTDNSVINFSSLDPKTAVKDSAQRDATKSVLLSTKKALKLDQERRDEINRDQQTLQGQIQDLTVKSETQKKVAKTLKKGLEGKTFVKNSFKPDKIQELTELSDMHDKLQSKYNEISNQVISSASNMKKSDLETEQSNLKTNHDKLKKSSKQLKDLTGKVKKDTSVSLSKIDDEIDSANASVSNNSSDTNSDSDTVVAPTSVGNVSATRKAIVKAALSQLGVPYVWGGTTPTNSSTPKSKAGLDCSGLSQYAYRQAGISLPRTSQQQSTVGKSIAISKAQPGDLLFWGNSGSYRGSAYHVAIVVSNNNGVVKYEAEPQPGQNASIFTVSAGFMPTGAETFVK